MTEPLHADPRPVDVARLARLRKVSHVEPAYPKRTRLRWWLDSKPYAIWRPGNLLLCLVTGHAEIENVNVRSSWDTHCAWCQKGMKPRA